MIKRAILFLQFFLLVGFSYSQSCSDGTQVCLSLDGGNLNYTSSADIAGFQFSHNGCVTDATGGDATANGFIISASSTVVIGFSFTGSVVPAGEGTLVVLGGDVNVDCMSNFIFSDSNGDPLLSEFGSSDDGGDDGGEEASCPDGTDVCLSLDGNNLNYESTADIAGFQFNHDGCAVNAGGGDAVANGFIVSASETVVLGFSFSGSVIPAGAGTLVDLGSADCTEESLSLFIFSDASGGPLVVDFPVLLFNGCTDDTACNYDPDADNDDGLCVYAEENYDCDGNCMIEIDCAGVCGGSLVIDACDVCGGNNACIGCSDWYMENFICDDTEATDKCCVEDDNNNDNRCKLNGFGNNCDFSLYCQREYEIECDVLGEYCDYVGGAVGDPCSTSEGSFTEGEGLCRKVCNHYSSQCFNITCDVLGEYCDYDGAVVGTPCSTSQGSFATGGEGLCTLNLSDDVNIPTGYITNYDTGCANGTDSCCIEPECNEPATLSLVYTDATTIQVNYISSVTIYGFEFHIPGTIISSGSGGVAGDNSWSVGTLNAGGDGALGVDLFGINHIPAGSGILTNLTVTIDASTENLCLTGVVLSAEDGASEIGTCPKYWQLTCISIP